MASKQDLSQQHIFITGATSGIGKATATALAQMGATVWFNFRTESKGQATQTEIREQSGNPRVFGLPCDLSKIEDIKSLGAQIREKVPVLDTLIHNAGVWMGERTETSDGLEYTFAVNHLAPFLLTHEVLSCLEAAPQGRIILVSSAVHTMGKWVPDDVQFQKRPFKGFTAYCESKLMNAMFTRTMSKKLASSPMTINCLHPGVVATGITRELPRWVQVGMDWIGLSPEKGARTTLKLATDPALSTVSGEFFSNQKIAKISKLADDEAACQQLWDMSCAYTGVKQDHLQA
ncbi:SDR family oxidoreductase [Pontibacter sp. G13]|uniref:SDR family oxidoreductase n=1 Tax=Pontibacter sp. G13 TaxID=3074898 RepID=UPI00288B67E4|nr:SDR family oxidoreductase [Pontibacter sp. G13]WNJ20137.1 SDR family oxidoreductase [Pontibacter sp. G13]